MLVLAPYLVSNVMHSSPEYWLEVSTVSAGGTSVPERTGKKNNTVSIDAGSLQEDCGAVVGRVALYPGPTPVY